VTEVLCRSVDGSGPCPFAGICPETRQRLQHYARLRGNACWAYQAIAEAHPELLPEVRVSEVAP